MYCGSKIKFYYKKEVITKSFYICIFAYFISQLLDSYINTLKDILKWIKRDNLIFQRRGLKRWLRFLKLV